MSALRVISSLLAAPRLRTTTDEEEEDEDAGGGDGDCGAGTISGAPKAMSRRTWDRFGIGLMGIVWLDDDEGIGSSSMPRVDPTGKSNMPDAWPGTKEGSGGSTTWLLAP